MDGIEVVFSRIPITGMIGCGVPVLPGTPDTEAPLKERAELCAVDAHWIVGMVPTCDHHVRLICWTTGIDWPDLVAEAGRGLESAETPWADRLRHSQDDARECLAHFTKGGSDA